MGAVAPDDAPAGYAGVARMLGSAAHLDEARDPSEALVTAMAAAVSTAPVATSRRKLVISKLTTAKVAAAGVGALALMGGTAAAATGNLPDVAQDKVASIASHVGVDLPDSASDTAAAVHKAQADTPPGPDRGKAVSDAAHEANAARKAAHDKAKDEGTETDDEGDDAATNGKSADAKAKAAEKKAAHQDDADDETDTADDDSVDAPDSQGADHATDPTTKAADPAQPHLDDAQAHRP